MTKENRQRPHRKTVQSLPVLLSAVFLKQKFACPGRLKFPAGEQDSLRDGFRHMENRGKPGCLQKKLFKTARYIHNACDKNIPDLGQRLPCPAPGRIAPFPIVMYP